MGMQCCAGGHWRNEFRALPLLPLFLLLAGGDAQPAPESLEKGSLPRFTAGVSMVVLPVTVLDGKGAFVQGLPEAAFQVFEDGVRQEIRLFEHEDVPVSVGLIVDGSGSMRGKRKDVARSALAFVRTSNPQDELFVVNFSDRPVLGLPATKLFSADLGELDRALAAAPAGGKTALYDAIQLGLKRLSLATRAKKVLIVISDGGDNASRHDLASTVEAAKRADVAIYTIGFFDQYDKDRNPRVLKRLARITGGEAFFPHQPEAAGKICERIAGEIRTQYTIGYVPANARLDGSYRRTRVKVTSLHRGKLLVRTRDGYVADPEPRFAKGETR